MAYFFQQIFYRPIFNVLIFFYENLAWHDLGIAIVLTTLLIRFVLYPLFHIGAKQQMLMQRIQPKVKKIQEMHKDDMQKQSQELMDLYKEHGVNPFSSIILLIVQIPIMLAFYWVVRSGFGAAQLNNLYAFIPKPETINSLFLGLIDLTKSNIILILLAALAQYLQARLAIYRAPAGTAPSPAEKMARQMSFIAPIMTIVIFYNLPSAIGLYWLVSSLFSVVQQYFINKHLQKKYGA